METAIEPSILGPDKLRIEQRRRLTQMAPIFSGDLRLFKACQSLINALLECGSFDKFAAAWLRAKDEWRRAMEAATACSFGSQDGFPERLNGISIGLLNPATPDEKAAVLDAQARIFDKAGYKVAGALNGADAFLVLSSAAFKNIPADFLRAADERLTNMLGMRLDELRNNRPLLNVYGGQVLSVIEEALSPLKEDLGRYISELEAIEASPQGVVAEFKSRTAKEPRYFSSGLPKGKDAEEIAQLAGQTRAGQVKPRDVEKAVKAIIRMRRELLGKMKPSVDEVLALAKNGACKEAASPLPAVAAADELIKLAREEELARAVGEDAILANRRDMVAAALEALHKEGWDDERIKGCLGAMSEIGGLIDAAKASYKDAAKKDPNLRFSTAMRSIEQAEARIALCKPALGPAAGPLEAELGTFKAEILKSNKGLIEKGKAQIRELQTELKKVGQLVAETIKLEEIEASGRRLGTIKRQIGLIPGNMQNEKTRLEELYKKISEERKRLLDVLHPMQQFLEFLRKNFNSRNDGIINHQRKFLNSTGLTKQLESLRETAPEIARIFEKQINDTKVMLSAAIGRNRLEQRLAVIKDKADTLSPETVTAQDTAALMADITQIDKRIEAIAAIAPPFKKQLIKARGGPFGRLQALNAAIEARRSKEQVEEREATEKFNSLMPRIRNWEAMIRSHTVKIEKWAEDAKKPLAERKYNSPWSAAVDALAELKSLRLSDAQKAEVSLHRAILDGILSNAAARGAQNGAGQVNSGRGLNSLSADKPNGLAYSSI
jgi:hypothetical protein